MQVYQTGPDDHVGNCPKNARTIVKRLTRSGSRVHSRVD